MWEARAGEPTKTTLSRDIQKESDTTEFWLPPPGLPLHTPFRPPYPPMQPKGFLCQKKSGVPLPDANSPEGSPLPRMETKLLTAQRAQRLASAHLSILIFHDSCLSQTPV